MVQFGVSMVAMRISLVSQLVQVVRDTYQLMVQSHDRRIDSLNDITLEYTLAKVFGKGDSRLPYPCFQGVVFHDRHTYMWQLVHFPLGGFKLRATAIAPSFFHNQLNHQTIGMFLAPSWGKGFLRRKNINLLPPKSITILNHHHSELSYFPLRDTDIILAIAALPYNRSKVLSPYLFLISSGVRLVLAIMRVP